MNTFLMASLLVSIAGSASAQSPQPANASTPLRAELTRSAIRQAVRQTLAEDKQEARLDDATVLGVAARYEHFARQFAEAKIPDCLHGDALKFQPTLPIAGVIQAPFVALAALRGKCRL